MKEYAIGVSGRIASGKTSLAGELAKELRCPLASFGEYVKYVALDRDLRLERAALQDLGESLVSAGVSVFCKSVLAYANWSPNKSIVIEGIRHLDVLEALRRVLSASVLNFSIDDII